MRAFALDCVNWAEHMRNPSDRETMLRVARMWMNTASGIERSLERGGELACADLRKKLD
jgi:hypothetical protein